MTVLAIVQARMSSRRLPGKVLAPVLGQPMIQRQIERISHAQLIDKLVIATSTMTDDDAIAEFCQGIGQPCYRGPLDDVLGRFVAALDTYGPADHVVRLTADCNLGGEVDGQSETEGVRHSQRI